MWNAATPVHSPVSLLGALATGHGHTPWQLQIATYVPDMLQAISPPSGAVSATLGLRAAHIKPPQTEPPPRSPGAPTYPAASRLRRRECPRICVGMCERDRH